MHTVSILLLNLFYPERHPTIGFPVNVESLAGDLKGAYGDDVKVTVLDMQQPGVTRESVLEHVSASGYDVIGVSVKTGQLGVARDLVDDVLELSEPQRPRYVMIGGYRPRVFHEEFATLYPRADVVTCVGEGEPSMRGMVEHLKGACSIDEVPNLVYMGEDGLVRTPRRQHDLTEWHAPSTSTLSYVLEMGGVVYLETSRGCTWGKCTFCSRKFMSGIKPSSIPVEKVAASWKLFQDRGVRHVYCADEDFMMNSREHGEALGRAFQEAGVTVKFWVQTTVDGILQLGRSYYKAAASGSVASKARKPGEKPRQDGARNLPQVRRAMEQLQSGGLNQVFLGLESGSASQLDRYRKGISPKEAADAIRECRDAGVEIETGFIPLDPFVTLDEIRETVEFIKEHDLAGTVVRILNTMCIQEGVTLFGQTKMAGLLTGPRDLDTFLYPYRFEDPRASQLADAIAHWNDHGLSDFTYALRRLVDANPLDPVSSGLLFKLRLLEFGYLEQLAYADPHEDRDIFQRCMKERFDIMDACLAAVRNGQMLDPNSFLETAFRQSRQSVQNRFPSASLPSLLPVKE